ncbi:hypothetical protein M431DRAFT_98229 [Trichoderma harzianum CBS 226.95]|uniref:Uncharacterized protein n=1 Tax=Trichoderma harzianum CBS 226.95 TaxID=983964 RepID=A0A2T3ZWH7_TRIHA|nr:hypothetical protein M431DRAFT_98229 [Trichoderma harzianum CBS 226.95]PTB49164.1 hypothetical protein M431DRAFT_98229 [Trichoderma harzianum CBS 226.95]
MEQHDTQLRRRDTLLARLSNPSNSLPAPPPSTLSPSPTATTQTTTADAPGLSASEPTLRFPRPQGNTQLANWISSSNPNMMDMPPPADDNGMAESTYELVSSPSTDNEESQDDHYPASMSESVGSLDIHRPDDVRSLAGTDDSFGTDNDDADTHGASSDRDETEDEEDDEDSVHEDTVMTESQIAHDESNKTEPFPPFKNDASQELLEYTDQSLGTPSYTPEASRVIERPADHDKKSFKKKVSELWQLESQVKEFLVENTLIPSATNGLALMPIGEAQSDDWIFGAKKPVVSFTAEAHNDILIHIPNSIKKTWLAKDCLTVTAKRGEVPVDTTMSLEDEGLRLKFAKRETHGVVSVILEAKCRPKIHKVVKVHFGKGLMEGALERTKHLAHLAQDLSGLVPAAAQEAERRIENAKQSLGSACQNVCQTVTETVSKTFGASFANFADVRQQLDDLVSTAKTQLDEATQGIASKIDKITQQAAENLPSVEDVQNQLQLQLLDAQLSAKLLWLQTFGSAEEHEEYLRKAKSYSADKHAVAAQSKLKHAKKEVQEKLTDSASRLWSMLRGKSACRQSSHEECNDAP